MLTTAADACKAFPDSRVRIFVKNGTYKEKLVVPSCNSHLSIIGESADKTIISFDDFFNKIDRGRNSTFYTYTLKVEANDFRLENITVENTAGPVGQAVALHVGCKLIAASGVDKVFLGRPWRSFAKVAFLNCELGSFITAEGWNNWSNIENEKTAQFAEYGNKGAGANTGKRVGWSVNLNDQEASKFNKENIFATLAREISSGKKWYNPD